MDSNEMKFNRALTKLDNAQKTLFNLKISVLSIPIAAVIAVANGNFNYAVANRPEIVLLLVITIEVYVFFLTTIILYFRSRYKEYDVIVKSIVDNVDNIEMGGPGGL